jgi:p-aminobenzoyl-glutamate transporter AbgT
MGMFRALMKGFRPATAKQMVLFVVLAMVFVLPSIGAFAQEEVELDISLNPFIESLNDFLPTALTIVGFAFGIAAAFALATYVGNALLNAFRGRSI